MGETIGDMDLELEQKDKNLSILENKIGCANDKVVEKLKKLDLNKISNQEKCERILCRVNKNT